MHARSAAAVPLLAALCLFAGAAAAQATETGEPPAAESPPTYEPGEEDNAAQNDTVAPVPTEDGSPTETSPPDPTTPATDEPSPTPTETETPPATDEPSPTPTETETPTEAPTEFSITCGGNASLYPGETTTVTVSAPSGTQLSPGAPSSLGGSVSLSGNQVTYTAPDSLSSTGQDVFTVSGTSPDGETDACSITFTVYGQDAPTSPPPEEPTGSPTDPGTESPDPESPGAEDPGTEAPNGGGAPTPTEDGPGSTPASSPGDLSVPGAPDTSASTPTPQAGDGYGLTLPGISGLMDPSSGNPHVPGGAEEDEAAEPSDEDQDESETQNENDAALAQTGASLWATLLALLAIVLGAAATLTARRPSRT
ncbi:hypothetical protein [Nesterenkonia populi]|uniref:hypothetical protein n=1 Tax=Nesterenkonia populi TaxID=1591087 RepID=UPI0011BD659C|nr:hypothetical protein [Nesterenkonia populi]